MPARQHQFMRGCIAYRQSLDQEIVHARRTGEEVSGLKLAFEANAAYLRFPASHSKKSH
jgi:hypothetical protein